MCLEEGSSSSTTPLRVGMAAGRGTGVRVWRGVQVREWLGEGSTRPPPRTDLIGRKNKSGPTHYPALPRSSRWLSRRVPPHTLPIGIPRRGTISLHMRPALLFPPDNYSPPTSRIVKLPH